MTTHHRERAAVSPRIGGRIALIAIAVASCVTPYHGARDLSPDCARASADFQQYGNCVWDGLGIDQPTNAWERDVKRRLIDLHARVNRGELTDEEAVNSFDRHVAKTADRITGERVKTGLIVGAATVATIGIIAAASSGGASAAVPNGASASTQSRAASHQFSLNGCCSHHGGIKGYLGHDVICQDGSLSPTCHMSGGRIVHRSPPIDFRGCCSWHQGICGYSGSQVVCCDGQPSPTCTIR